MENLQKLEASHKGVKQAVGAQKEVIEKYRVSIAINYWANCTFRWTGLTFVIETRAFLKKIPIIIMLFAISHYLVMMLQNVK